MDERKDASLEARQAMSGVLAELESIRLFATNASIESLGQLHGDMRRLACEVAGPPPWPQPGRTTPEKTSVRHEIRVFQAVLKRSAKKMRAEGDVPALRRLTSDVRMLPRPSGLEPVEIGQYKYREICEALHRIRGRSHTMFIEGDPRVEELFTRISALEKWLDES
jgi:hypothetical protein